MCIVSWKKKINSEAFILFNVFFRSLYIALFKHMIYVGSRACYRTALEFCKLLLSFDPEGDPLAIVLAIDFYALRSQEYEWLIRIGQEWEASRNLSQVISYCLFFYNYNN